MNEATSRTVEERQLDDAKSPERLEQEADAARAIGTHGRCIEQPVIAGRVARPGIALGSRQCGEFGRNLGNQVKQNPMPLVVTAIGLSWLIFGSRPRAYRQTEMTGEQYATEDLEHDRSSVGTDSAPRVIDRVSDTAHKAKDMMKDAIDSTTSGVSEVVGGAKDAVKGATARVGELTHAIGYSAFDARERMRETTVSTRETLATLLDEQPLVVGGLGIVLGAVLGAMLPSTEAEDRLFGATSSR